MFLIFKIEPYLHRILFSFRDKILELSHSLWFPWERTPIDDYAKDGGEECFTEMHCVL